MYRCGLRWQQGAKNTNKKNIMNTQAIKDTIFFVTYYKKFDRRKAFIKAFEKIGFTEKDAFQMADKKRQRMSLKNSSVEVMTLEQKKVFLQILKECTFDLNAFSSRYNCTGIDYKAFHRPSSNGKGWVLIAPDEPMNNSYTEDPILLKYLTKKFLA